jgi:hypothetical protein
MIYPANELLLSMTGLPLTKLQLMLLSRVFVKDEEFVENPQSLFANRRERKIIDFALALVKICAIIRAEKMTADDLITFVSRETGISEFAIRDITDNVLLSDKTKTELMKIRHLEVKH